MRKKIGIGFYGPIRAGACARHGVLLMRQDKPTCGAKTRKGTKCQCKPVESKRRCKFHGGKSTGPKSAEGRERIAAAQRERWRQFRERKASEAISDASQMPRRDAESASESLWSDFEGFGLDLG